MVVTFCATCTVTGYPCLSFFFVFHGKSGSTQVIVGRRRAIYHIEAVAVVIPKYIHQKS